MSFKAAPFCMHVQAVKVNKLLNAKDVVLILSH